MVHLYKQGEFIIEKIGKTHGFEDIIQAFDDSHNGKVIKSVLRISR